MIDHTNPWLEQSDIPLLLCDVDGVLNVFGANQADIQWSVGRADPDTGTARVGGWGSGGYKYTITWDPTIIDRLKQLHESGKIRFMWLTTWGHGANGDLRTLLGMDEMAVAYHPSNSDLHTRDDKWWKLRTVRWFVENNPDRKIIWCDDELARNTDATTFASGYNVLCVGPPEYRGLTHDDLDKIEAFIDS